MSGYYMYNSQPRYNVTPQQQTQTQQIDDDYRALAEHDPFLAFASVPKHVVKVRETTNLILFTIFGILFVFAVDSLARMASKLSTCKKP